MLREMLKAKIHRATITQAHLDYEGSLTIDVDLMHAAGIVPFERVHVYNINTGDRFETYAIEGKAGSGVIGLNGAAARKGMVGDLVIVATYVLVEQTALADFKPTILLVDENNAIKRHINK
ncbi:MAG: aspartate 1-decarboxylase [Desulfobulbaceae bacterium A2]|nr:MAG: aspartate 1-decarboxylase [Desulfobulbaceae bacterium A2]